ncbi:hypothetical protein L6255_00505 [Candidatus Parcubacteria bacterium]|nr:hypothetical protein [Patescibacteria group bacterium]MBU4380861.1 hypothetical protein [Patescibacteria group bacterium]MCG2688912.1 hypothetical protein [Candidatus Parcubacteria bacterium]
MKIWFGTTTLHFSDYKEYYLKIREHLLSLGHVLTDDWIGTCGDWIEQHPNTKRDIKEIYESVTKAVRDANVSIIEFTVPNFSTSHQITYSLQLKKPTLVLRLKRENSFPDSYIEALNSPYLTIKFYTLTNYKEIIDEFLGYSSIEDNDGRYNIVLSKKQKYYLDWACNKYGQSRSKIIRGLIEVKIQDDKTFKSSFSH